MLGPRPSEYREKAIRPNSWISDDHTPVEFIYVIDGDDWRPSIRFAMEPLSPVDGAPLPPQAWKRTLDNMSSKYSIMKGYDTTWPDICYNTLIDVPQNESQTQHSTQFFLGCDFTPSGMVGKFYYIPKLRAASDKCSEETLVTNCLRSMAIPSMESSWSLVTQYLDSLPPTTPRPTLEMVAVDSVSPSKNRIKIYYRSHENTIEAIIQHLTLGGTLNDPTTLQTISIFRTLSGYLFPGASTTDALMSKRNWPGFLMYFELTPKSQVPFPKVYIPVRQYCANDAQIADAVGKYLRSTGNTTAGDRYAAEFQRLMKHRNLDSRTGIHTYIACCGRPSGPQLSMYLSPEVFAPERRDSV
ncbi:aromatic prenyltransferase [Agrocybe pediades]|nr:aromatic prenyltransferase [Agrocybe pediades]